MEEVNERWPGEMAPFFEGTVLHADQCREFSDPEAAAVAFSNAYPLASEDEHLADCITEVARDAAG